MIVVDLGCATYPEFPEDESVNRLIERFQPFALYGFDPNPATQKSRSQGDTLVVIEQKAAWTHDGVIGYVTPPVVMNDLRSYTGWQAGPAAVDCFDLARFLFEMSSEEIVLKMDVESAEYVLIPHLIDTATDDLLSLLLVEWHGDETGSERRRLIGMLSCPVEAW